MKRYINEFFKLKCAPDLLTYKLFPNAKEITESFAAFRGVATLIMPGRFDFNSENVKIICVGDGHTPRTAALFAMRTKWDCYSVDPVLRNNEYPITRLSLYNNKIEDLDLSFPDDIVVIVCVHSHAKIKDMLDYIHGKERHLLSIPCCVTHEIADKQYIGYLDTNIWSDKNLVKVWVNI